MDLSPAIATTLVAALGVPLCLALLRRMKTFRHFPDRDKGFAQLSSEYARWELMSLPVLMVVVGLIAWVLWLGLDAVYQRQLVHRGPGLFLVQLPAIVWWIPAFFLALFLAAIPQHFLYLALLGRVRYAEYIEYGNQKFGIDSWKLFRYLGNLTIPLCLLLTFLALDTYTRVTRDAFVVNEFFGVGETAYRFSDLQAIVLVETFVAANGDVVSAPHYVIRFDDGSAFDFRRSPTETAFAQQQVLVRFLQTASGIEVVRESAQAS